MAYIIETFRLTKEFTPTKGLSRILLHPFRKENPALAIDNVTIEVREGEIFCLIGPNGAGKTTLIKILACLILPTKGSAKVAGYDILTDEEKVRHSIGLVTGDERSFYWRLTLRQNLYFFAMLYNLSASEAERKIRELGALLQIDRELDKRFQECSTGIKQRLSIARGLLNNPKLLFMDEPTKSLDPTASRDLKDFIREELVKIQGKTIVFTTHNLSEAEDFVDRIAIIQKGDIMTCGSLPELRNKMNLENATLEEIYDSVTNSDPC